MPPETATVDTALASQTPATPPSSETTPPPSTPSYTERVEQVLREGGENAKKYRLTGELPEYKAPSSEVKPAASSTAPEPESTVTAPVNDKPPQKKKEIDQDRNWSEVRRQLSEKDGQIDLLKRQLAEKGSSAPPAKEEAKAPPADPRPKLPNIANFDDEKKYQDAMDKWFDDDTAWQQRQVERRFSTEKQTATTEKASTQWNERLTAAKSKYKDFEAVAFSESVPASGAMIHLIQTLENGPDVAYWLGKNLEAASRIAELTDIPGLDALRKSNPVEAAMKWGEALGLARAEFSRLDLSPKSPKTPAAPPKPLKEIITAAPRPSLEVEAEGGAAPIQDPIARALADAKANPNDPSAFARYKKLQNEKDLAERKGRR